MTYDILFALNNEYINIKDNWWHFLTNDMGRIGAMWLVFWLRGLEPRVDGDDPQGLGGRAAVAQLGHHVDVPPPHHHQSQYLLHSNNQS